MNVWLIFIDKYYQDFMAKAKKSFVLKDVLFTLHGKNEKLCFNFNETLKYCCSP